MPEPSQDALDFVRKVTSRFRQPPLTEDVLRRTALKVTEAVQLASKSKRHKN